MALHANYWPKQRDRVKKTSDTEFTLLVASVQHKVSGHQNIEIQGKVAKLTVEYGDFTEPLAKVAAALKEVKYSVFLKVPCIDGCNVRTGEEIRCQCAPGGHDRRLR